MFFHGFQFLLRGGPMMWPLLVCAIISVTVIVERAWALRRASVGGEELTARVRRLLREGRDDEALRAAAEQEGPVAAILEHALRNGSRDPRSLERSLEELAQEETPRIIQRLGVLDTIITISPLLGLLGTVTGMIRAFNVVGDPSSLNGPAVITGGVAEALIATASGLAIAIVTLVAYNWLGVRAKAIVSLMERGATQVVNIYADRREGESAHEAEAARA